MKAVLLAWIGDADFHGAGIELAGRAPALTPGPGPIASAIEVALFERVVLVNSRKPRVAAAYAEWLETRASAEIEVVDVTLRDPTDHREIYETVEPICEAEVSAGHRLTYHLSPGTPAMASVWLLLGKTKFPGALIRSSRERGVEPANVPFDISAELLPDLLAGPGAMLGDLSAESTSTQADFAQIIGRSPEIRRAIRLASRVAVWPVPVLLEGESGTGKELFARAIHAASGRADRPIVAVNCGALPTNLVESLLFGHIKGAFTDADARAGYFEQAHGGTLFLDEVGELPLEAQVKLLRVLETSEIRRIGSDRPKRVDVRIVAATNRSLVTEVSKARFREDLFYRLAVARLKLPPLRERKGDLTALLDAALAQVNRDGLHSVPGYETKRLSAGARNLLMQHTWPGNVRELIATVRRAAIWTEGATIRKRDAEQALVDPLEPAPGRLLSRRLGDGFSLRALLAEVATHYIERALEQAGGTKTHAARLLGFSSHQTFTNWAKRYGAMDRSDLNRG